MKEAELNAEYLCGGGGAAMIIACKRVPWCWVGLTATGWGLSGTAFAGTTGYDRCKNWMNTYAAENICTR